MAVGLGACEPRSDQAPSTYAAPLAAQATEGITPSDAPQSDTMLILSYNICWECMSHSTKRGSARQLGALCTWDGPIEDSTTMCARNMAADIDTIPSLSGFANYDLVGLQESSHWRALQRAAQGSLAQLQPVSHKSKDEFIVSFYDSSRYSLSQHIPGEFAPGRPFQISIFNEDLIFVNLHFDNGPSDMALVEEALSTALQAAVPERAGLNDDRIIVCGDFNLAVADSLMPFKGAGINTVCHLATPPITCCSNDVPWKAGTAGRKAPGDLIFDSRTVARPTVPSTYDAKLPQSDHLPVVAILPTE